MGVKTDLTQVLIRVQEKRERGCCFRHDTALDSGPECNELDPGTREWQEEERRGEEETMGGEHSARQSG